MSNTSGGNAPPFELVRMPASSTPGQADDVLLSIPGDTAQGPRVDERNRYAGSALVTAERSGVMAAYRLGSTVGGAGTLSRGLDGVSVTDARGEQVSAVEAGRRYRVDVDVPIA